MMIGFGLAAGPDLRSSGTKEFYRNWSNLLSWQLGGLLPSIAFTIP
jgi:hypothetical protein